MRSNPYSALRRQRVNVKRKAQHFLVPCVKPSRTMRRPHIILDYPGRQDLQFEPIGTAFDRLSADIDNARSLSFLTCSLTLEPNEPAATGEVLETIIRLLEDSSVDILALSLGGWIFNAPTMTMLTTAFDGGTLRSVRELGFGNCNLTSDAAVMDILTDFMSRRSRIIHLEFGACTHVVSDSFGRNVGQLVGSSTTALTKLAFSSSLLPPRTARRTGTDGEMCDLVGELLEQISVASLPALRLSKLSAGKLEAVWQWLPDQQGLRQLTIETSENNIHYFSRCAPNFQSSLLGAFRANCSLLRFVNNYYTFEQTRHMLGEHAAARVSMYTARNQRLPELLLLVVQQTVCDEVAELLPLLPSLLAAARSYNLANVVRPAAVRNFFMGLCYNASIGPYPLVQRRRRLGLTATYRCATTCACMLVLRLPTTYLGVLATRWAWLVHMNKLLHRSTCRVLYIMRLFNYLLLASYR
jgi:hypothetical protein